MIYKEVEFKYDAKNISLENFTKYCENKDYNSKLEVCGVDYFYCPKIVKSGSFYRIRKDNSGVQLTFKSKTSNENNVIRIEHNLDLKNGGIESAASYIKDLNYEYSGSLFKICFIYTFEFYTLVYYVCYDKEIKELGRFIEIEMNEHYNWESEKEAYEQLIMLEKVSSGLGINKKLRVNESLYEMFGNKG